MAYEYDPVDVDGNVIPPIEPVNQYFEDIYKDKFTQTDEWAIEWGDVVKDATGAKPLVARQRFKPIIERDPNTIQVSLT